MGSIAARLRVLEGRRGPCEVCDVVDDFEVEWVDGAAPDPEPDPEPEKCPACGRRLVYVVTWGDEA